MVCAYQEQLLSTAPENSGTDGAECIRTRLLLAQQETPIYAADGGTISEGRLTFGGYGNCVIIKHDNGQETLYDYCSKRKRRG